MKYLITENRLESFITSQFDTDLTPREGWKSPKYYKEFLRGKKSSKESKKYTLSKTFNGRIYYGANPYHNGTTAFKYFKNISEFTYSDAKISDIYIINKVLNRFETLYFYNLIHPSNDLVYNVPSGTRSFIDKIEKTFNFNIPMFKSNYFNLKILKMFAIC